MAERRTEQQGATPGATSDGSRGKGTLIARLRSDPVPAAILVLGILAGVLMVAAEVSTIASVKLSNVETTCEVLNDSNPDLAERCDLSGFERHSGALLLLGLLTLVRAWGAGAGGSRPAGFALLGVGAVVLGLALLLDLPVTDDTGAIGQQFEGAKAQAGRGFAFEISGGILAVLAGLVRLSVPAAAREPMTPPPGEPPAQPGRAPASERS